jgi:hypothetical protein
LACALGDQCVVIDDQHPNRRLGWEERPGACGLSGGSSPSCAARVRSSIRPSLALPIRW